MDFRTMVGIGDMVTAGLALLALVGLRAYGSRAIGLVWLCIGVGMIDTVNAIIQSVRYSVFDYPLGVNWTMAATALRSPDAAQ